MVNPDEKKDEGPEEGLEMEKEEMEQEEEKQEGT